jgi:hypothetical protein
MILSEKVEVIINPNNIKWYNSLGYENIKCKDTITIIPEHLGIGSHVKIHVKCDSCENEKDIEYREYVKSISKYNKYACSSKCAQFKNKETNLERYGVEYISQNEDIKNIIKQTNLEKFGVEYASQNEDIKNKVKQTNLEKFGVENPSQCLSCQEKRKETMLERHGVEYYVLSNDFKEKSEETSLKHYGTKHPNQNEENKIKIKEKFIENGFHINDNEYKIYGDRVYRETRKNKKELLEKWDGLDYYDNEYIRDNFSLPYHHKNYPTIDHIIPINYGYENNIPFEELAKIENLVITKRTINSQKYIKMDFIYKEKNN